MTQAGIRGQRPDGEWIPVSVNTVGAIDVTLQDSEEPIVGLVAINETGTITLDSAVAIDDYTLTLVAAHGVIVGDVVEFYEGTRWFQAFAIGVATDVITLDRPFEFAFTTVAIGKKGTHNMNVDGSSTPVIFRVTNKHMDDGEHWDISSFNLSITDQTAMDDAKFGGISGLSRGLLGRVKNSIYHNLYLAKTNQDLKLGFNEVVYSSKAPAGFFGLIAKTKVGGQGNLGSIVRLHAIGDDEIQFIVQDDLQLLDTLIVLVGGSRAIVIEEH